VCIGFATVIEKSRGTDFVSEYIYGAWWFSALWAILTVAALYYIMKQQLYKRVAVMLLHVSFVVILAGALVTHLTAQRDTIHLRIANTYNLSPTTQITLKEFRIINYPGTDAPLDYQSVILHNEEEVLVSMNHIGHIDGYRLFQKSYDTDGEGVTLGYSYDPYGIAITYFGYLMLLVGIIATLFSRHTQMRALYRKAITIALLLVSISASADDKLPVVDEDIAHRMGTINVLYNNRICPLNTVATDFVMKITGSASWKGYSADEVFFSWMIYYMPWEKELLVNNTRKGGEERNAVVEMFYNGQFTKIFPYRIGDAVDWYSPGGQVLPREIPVKEQFFIKQSMDFLTESIVTGQKERAFEIIAKIKLFQREMIGDVLPSEHKTEAELFYNKLRSIKFPILVTLQLGLRWWLSGHIPLSNGYETMLFMAWVLLVLTVVLFRKFRIILWLGPLATLCCLLVAMIAGSGSQITPLMPVLQSPLLSLHVMTVMCAYALFALQMLIGIYAFWTSKLERITALSQLLLYPAVFLLTIGIFLGAVWANVSWGNYWSWDPKESWALITLMIYAVPLHKASIGIFRNPRFYHLYIVIAFLAVLITYFGVNYLLGGMHSYA
jgi:ABC-type transport system involved in cytochrome c biogenesis permease subunit